MSVGRPTFSLPCQLIRLMLELNRYWTEVVASLLDDTLSPFDHDEPCNGHNNPFRVCVANSSAAIGCRAEWQCDAGEAGSPVF